MLVVAVIGACSSAPPAKPPPPRATDAITVPEWKTLCETQADRARRCPGPAPEDVAVCTTRMSCFGELVRPEVIRGLLKCQADTSCAHPCSMDRVAASLPRTATNRELVESCAMRRSVCPQLDCNAITRPVQVLEAGSTAPLVDCMKYGGTCLEVASCVLEKMTPILAKATACAPSDPAPGAGPPPPREPIEQTDAGD